jgi:YggT family protein
VIDILFDLVYYVVNLFKWAVILAALFSILTSFGVLDTRNRIVWTIGDFLYRVTDPILRPIRNILPNFGGIDLSPWVVVVLIQIVILPLLFRLQLAITNGIVQPLLYG